MVTGRHAAILIRQSRLLGARIRDEIKRLETVHLAISDAPLARQSAVEERMETTTVSPRSKAGRGGTRAYRGKSQKKMR